MMPVLPFVNDTGDNIVQILRMAKEAEERKNAPVKATSARGKKAAPKTKQKPKGLADWLKTEQDAGRNN
jgi:DNA repair photolyase